MIKRYNPHAWHTSGETFRSAPRLSFRQDGQVTVCQIRLVYGARASSSSSLSDEAAQASESNGRTALKHEGCDSSKGYLQKGFTIVELMIATTVLSVILLMATVIITGIGNLYYKGVNQSKIQDAARNIADEVAQNLELGKGYTTASGAPGTHGEKSYCMSTARYTYVLGKQIGTNGLNHILWRDTVPSTGCATLDLSLAQPSAGGVEMIGSGSRLSNFNILPATSPYTITVFVAYGDDVLLQNPSGTSPTCLGNKSDSFCATAALTTTVVQRVHQ
ncbi:MAG TPA: prepilin-type N-terminal cleavage/methylation domain-containing protein [Candidatus Saccharimonadales bacterium]|nr:prepilin-type N-terminal cleavage/methylation domain-containing protein [Candidatus Saccharimonadales bacterium]